MATRSTREKQRPTAFFAFQDGLSERVSESAASGSERNQASDSARPAAGDHRVLPKVPQSGTARVCCAGAVGNDPALQAALSTRPRQGAKLTQLMGLCRGRTHIPMALCVAPAPWRFAATMKTGNVYRQAAGPRNGRLAIECDVQRAVGPFWVGRRFQHSTPHTWGREPRGYLCLRWCGGSDSGGKVLLNAPRERLRQRYRHRVASSAARAASMLSHSLCSRSRIGV